MRDPDPIVVAYPKALGALMRIRLKTEQWLADHPNHSFMKPLIQNIRNETEDALRIEKDKL